MTPEPQCLAPAPGFPPEGTWIVAQASSAGPEQLGAFVAWDECHPRWAWIWRWISSSKAFTRWQVCALPVRLAEAGDLARYCVPDSFIAPAGSRAYEVPLDDRPQGLRDLRWHT